MAKCYASEVIKVAKNEVGYQEKASNSKLEFKHLNVGGKNFTKYGKEMGCNGQPYCDAFVDWCFKKAYGEADAKRLLGGFSNYTPTSAQYFRNIHRYYKRSETNPKVGDVIFFYSNSLKRIAHTGIVYKVDTSKKKVYTIEGNTSSNSTQFERDGGCVAYKEYSLENARIDGYGRPAYDKEPKSPTITKECNLYKSNTRTKGYYGELKAGTKITFVKDMKYGWSKVKATIGSKTYTGYVKNSCIGNKSGLSKYRTGTILESVVVVRKRNKKGSEVITKLKKNDKVTVVSVGKFWVNVKFTKDKKSYDGFVYVSRIKVSK